MTIAPGALATTAGKVKPTRVQGEAFPFFSANTLTSFEAIDVF